MKREFPAQASEWLDPVGRRGFLKLMGASMALAGATACTRQPDELIVPYVRQPEDVVPGKPLFFATTMTLGGVGAGLLAESHEGRPTKLEGNPDHPSSVGATDALRAGVRPARCTTPTARSRSRISARSVRGRSFVQAMQNAARRADGRSDGAGLRFLTETVGSPTLGAQLKELLDGAAAGEAGTSTSPSRARTCSSGARARVRRAASTSTTASIRPT